MFITQINTGERPVHWVAAATAISWLGEYIHNRIELPGLSVFSPENSVLAIVAAALFLLWWLVPARRFPSILLIGLALLHFFGGAILSVIPFSFLPFYPEQTFRHYLAHLLYGLAQLPLILLLVRSRLERQL